MVNPVLEAKFEAYQLAAHLKRGWFRDGTYALDMATNTQSNKQNATLMTLIQISAHHRCLTEQQEALNSLNDKALNYVVGCV
jgi:hypothetical protein